jgi:signal transduction histidine kinase
MGLRSRTHFAAFAALAVVLGAGAYGLAQIQASSREEAVDQFEKRATLSSSLAASLLDRSTASRAERAARQLASAHPGLPALHDYLIDLDTKSSAGLLVGFDGRVLAETPGTGRDLLYRVALSPLAKQAAFTGGIVEVGGTPSIVRSVAYLTPYGRRIAIDAEPVSGLDRFFKSYLAGASGVANGQAYLVDAAGRIVASGGALDPGRKLPDSALSRALVKDRTGTFVDGDGDRYVSVQVPRSSLRVVLEARQRDLFATLTGGPDGRPAWLLYGAFAIAVTIGLGLLFRIVERNRRLAIAEREARAQIELGHERAETERLKGEFFALVSHELRTPLTSILGYIELITEREGEQMSDSGRRSLQVVSRNADRLDALVQDLLMVAQIEAGTFGIEPGEVDIGELAAHCREEQGPVAAARGIALSVSAEDLPPFAGDPRRLSQVLDNLVSNAIKFTPDGGNVGVSIADVNGACVIEVADTGAGIEPDDMAQLFNRFYRTRSADREQVKGAGLGLAIVKAIVDAHDGEISAESSREGSVFRVSIPMPAIRRHEDAPSALTV